MAFVVTLAFLFRLPCTFLWLPTCAMRTGCFPDARDTSMSHALSSTLQRNQKRRRNATCDGAAPPKEAAGRHGGDASGPVPDEDRWWKGEEILVGERRGKEGRGSRVRLEGRVGSNAGANRIDPRIDRGKEDPRGIVVQGRTSPRGTGCETRAAWQRLHLPQPRSMTCGEMQAWCSKTTGPEDPAEILVAEAGPRKCSALCVVATKRSTIRPPNHGGGCSAIVRQTRPLFLCWVGHPHRSCRWAFGMLLLAQVQLAEVCLDVFFRIRLGGQASGKVFRLFHPELVVYTSVFEFLGQVDELRLSFDFQHDLVHVF